MVSALISIKILGRVRLGVLLLVSLLVLAACGTSAPTATQRPPQAAMDAEATSLPEPTTVLEPVSALEPAAALAVAQAGGGPGKIGFVSSRDGNPELYVMNADGSNQTRLTYDPAEDAGPTWSPDGSKIAFMASRDGNPELYVMDADGSNQTRLTHSAGHEIMPDWSPDGSRIAYVTRIGEGNWEIYAMDADGSNQTRLTFNLRVEQFPAWSPDSTRIAYVVDFGAEASIFVMNADGSNQLNLTHNVSKDRSPAWSPDGTRIAFSSPRIEANFDIWVMNVDGTNPTRLTTGVGDEGMAAWSTDGMKIVFLARESRHYPDDPGGIFVMNADGSGIIRLTTDDFEAEVRSSSPDWASGSVPTGLVTKPPPTANTSEPAPETIATGLQLVGTALTEPLESPLAGVWVNGNYAYVGSQSISYEPGGFRTGIRIVDISDPSNPTLVGRIPLRSFEYDSEPSDVHSHGDAVATRIESAAFQGDIAIVLQGVPDTFGADEYPVPFGIWDVTDPADPQFLSSLSLGNWFSFDILGDKLADTKAVKGHYFYTIYSLGKPVHANPSPDKHLAIVDMSDPRNPVVVGDWQDTKQVHLRGLSVNDAGTRVYIVGQFGKELLLYVLDVQDPANPVELGRFVWPYPFAGDFSPGRPVANADDSVVIFADGSWDEGRSSRLHILDISDLSSIREISAVAFPESDTHSRGQKEFWAHDLAIVGDLVYSTWLGGGVQAIDISDPTNPVVVGGFFSPDKRLPWLSDMAMYGDYAVAVTVWGPGLYILRPGTETAPAGQEPKTASKQTLAQDPTALRPILGRWEGVLQIPGEATEIVVEFWTDEAGAHGSMTFTSPGFEESGPLTDIRFESPIVRFEADEGPVFKGELEGDTVSGTAELLGEFAPFSLKRTADGREP